MRHPDDSTELREARRRARPFLEATRDDVEAHDASVGGLRRPRAEPDGLRERMDPAEGAADMRDMPHRGDLVERLRLTTPG